MELPDKVIELAKKLYELKERGIGGEKENASIHFNRILQKYNLTIEDIIGTTKTEREFLSPKDKRQLLAQIAASVVGSHVKVMGYRDGSPKEDYVYINLTDAEYVEIQSKFDFYWDAYQKDLKFFYEAFIHKNNLGAKADGNTSTLLTDEERVKLKRMFEMMEVLDNHQFQKRIS